jgi:hypothetical protein|tara:strand:- start:2 stop:157 length:156 start_codon:yes stop_codon:yes gene_type:complete
MNSFFGFYTIKGVRHPSSLALLISINMSGEENLLRFIVVPGKKEKTSFNFG